LVTILKRINPSDEDRVFQKFGLNRNHFVLVTLHRPPNVDDKNNLRKIMHFLNHLSLRTPVIFPVHPRTKKNINGLDTNYAVNGNFKIVEPLRYKEFITLEKYPRFVVTDSGGIQEETTYLNIPCLTLRPNTERPVTITEGTNELVTYENIDLRHTIEKAVESARPLAVKKRLELTCAISPAIEMITGDRRRVEQILLNLISNAIKFTEKGSVKIEGESEGDNVTIRVMDTGIGIKTEDMETIFQAFRQIDSGVTRKYEGTGLGLSISKKLVELMGGHIRVTSVWGSGSTFSFSLPNERKDV
jgi:two-component sensor histidine kinase